MKRIEDFSLEKHPGYYEHWPTQSKLYKSSEYVGIKLSGYVIERQYLLDTGHYFFIISYDCPFEEQCDLLLLNKTYKPVSKRSLLPWFYGTWHFEGDTYLGENRLLLTFNTITFLEITLKPYKLFSRRRISIKKIEI